MAYHLRRKLDGSVGCPECHSAGNGRGPIAYFEDRPGDKPDEPPAAGHDTYRPCKECGTDLMLAEFGPAEHSLVPDEETDAPSEGHGIAGNQWLNPPRPIVSPEADDPFTQTPLTDLGNADRLVMRFGDRIRFVHEWGWMVYDGKRWRRDTLGTLQRFAGIVARELGLWSLQIDDKRAQQAALQHYIRSSNDRGLQAMIRQAEAVAKVRAEVADFDREPHIFNTQTGAVNLRDGTQIEHSPELMLSHISPVGYSAKADAPHFLAFLQQITLEDSELAGFLQEVAGYSLTGERIEHGFFFYYGEGGNGKTTYLEALKHVLGDYGTALSADALVEKRNGTPTERVNAELVGIRMAIAVEPPQNAKWREEFIKQMTGGDEQRARNLFKESFRFIGCAKLHVAANHKPAVRGGGKSWWRRFRMLPFRADIPENQQDKQLPKKLELEAAGILAWAIQGARRYYDRGRLNAPAIVIEANREYQEDEDVFGRFIEEACEIWEGPGPAPQDYWVSRPKLRKEHAAWAERSGDPPLDQRSLYARIRSYRAGLIGKERKEGNVRGFVGLRIRPELDLEAYGNDDPRGDWKGRPVRRLTTE